LEEIRKFGVIKLFTPVWLVIEKHNNYALNIMFLVGEQV
jgi:hypothetical protein